MTRLSTQDIEAIRNRVEEAREYGHEVGGIVFGDVPALLAEVEAQQSQIQRLAQDWSAVVDERNSLLAEVERLRAVIADFADYGTRHDTNPTIGGRIRRFDDVAGWVAYLRSMDDSVRRRAKEALGE